MTEGHATSRCNAVSKLRGFSVSWIGRRKRAWFPCRMPLSVFSGRASARLHSSCRIFSTNTRIESSGAPKGPSMRSMTGYGEASGENPRHGITVSLRAVNHRFLDLQLRIGEELRGSEAALRDTIGREISRGRVEARVEMRSVAERRATVQVNMG